MFSSEDDVIYVFEASFQLLIRIKWTALEHFLKTDPPMVEDQRHHSSGIGQWSALMSFQRGSFGLC